MAEVSSHKIYMNGRWEIRDLSFFPHRYEEVYSFLYSLTAPPGPRRDQVIELFNRYPWRGGYSAVNFYNDLYRNIPRDDRPLITGIRYASPGYIELTAVILIVTQIDKILSATMKAWDHVDRKYTTIHKRAMERRLLSLNVKEREQKLAHDDVLFALEACKELADAIGLDNPQALEKLNNNPVARLKILMAFYRRLRQLGTFVEEGKVVIESSEQRRIQVSLDDAKRQ